MTNLTYIKKEPEYFSGSFFMYVVNYLQDKVCKLKIKFIIFALP
ncbi:hypothetical protein AHMF7616_03380 [Adhaeribacter pallidiroseus]|uniref:Uncharacterized protein n=1 Tax=Adhaeribacter pallidiroseus TaxID=2072847 RepID=A0A369QJ76_9BACT|nr:hypothetical protein AHMF7616_03380 [Adhaeribacter pallidiroseus]